MHDVIVVGAGILGLTIAEAFRRAGAGVLNIDDLRPMGGTAPSGGHLKPSWFGDLKKAEYEPAMQLLADLWGMSSESYGIWPLGSVGVTATVYRIDTDRLLAHRDASVFKAEVTELNGIETICPAVCFNREWVGCRLLVIATGAWAAQLVPGLRVTAKQGVSFRFFGRLEQPLIKPWAPYKQVVAHQQNEREVWAGDGTAIIPANWKEVQVRISEERCRNSTGLKGLARNRMGLRPYAEPLSKGEPCLLKQLGPRAWVVTGAGKSGTIAAGWAARRLLDQLA